MGFKIRPGAAAGARLLWHLQYTCKCIKVCLDSGAWFWSMGLDRVFRLIRDLMRLCCVTGVWRGALVAVKIVSHDCSLASLAETLRESALSTSIHHPHVVCLARKP